MSGSEILVKMFSGLNKLETVQSANLTEVNGIKYEQGIVPARIAQGYLRFLLYDLCIDAGLADEYSVQELEEALDNLVWEK